MQIHVYTGYILIYATVVIADVDLYDMHVCFKTYKQSILENSAYIDTCVCVFHPSAMNNKS